MKTPISRLLAKHTEIKDPKKFAEWLAENKEILMSEEKSFLCGVWLDGYTDYDKQGGFERYYNNNLK